MAAPKLVVQSVSTHPFWRGRQRFCASVLRAAAKAEGVGGAVSLLLGGDEDLQRLNASWRGKDRPTNVLSFPAAPNAARLLGDIALAAQTVRQEAQDQGKSAPAHIAHLLVHGFLHLLGHDHEAEEEAEAMEARERAILRELGYDDPYAVRDAP